MREEDSTDDTTEINWECHDGTDHSVITIDGVSQDTRSRPAESRALRQRRELREQLVREHIENANARLPFIDRVLKTLFRRG